MFASFCHAGVALKLGQRSQWLLVTSRITQPLGRGESKGEEACYHEEVAQAEKHPEGGKQSARGREC